MTAKKIALSVSGYQAAPVDERIRSRWAADVFLRAKPRCHCVNREQRHWGIDAIAAATVGATICDASLGRHPNECVSGGRAPMLAATPQVLPRALAPGSSQGG